MNDTGKTEKPSQPARQSVAQEPSPTTEHEGAGLPAKSGFDKVLAQRAHALESVRWRATGGQSGVAPAGHIAAERRNVIGSAAARLMRKQDGPASSGAIPKTTGSPLSLDVKAKMEGKLGADLSSVRIHNGAESAKAASDFGARAFTVGKDVHFNAGQFAPGTKEGDRLLAHELTHTVQASRSGIQRKAEDDGEKHEGAPEVSSPDEPAEQEADTIANHVTDELHDDDKAAEGNPNSKRAPSAKKEAKEAAPTIGAKLDGSRVFRAVTGPTPPAPTPSPAPDPELTLPQIQQEIVTSLASKNPYTASEVAPYANKIAPGSKIKRSELVPKLAAAPEPEMLLEWRVTVGDEPFATEFCKHDSIATRNLNQVKGANPAHFEGGGSVFNQHRTGFFDALGNKLMAGTAKRSNAYSNNFYDASVPFRFKGKKITDKLPQMLSRTMSYPDFKKYNVDGAALEAAALAWYKGQSGKNVSPAVFKALPNVEQLKEEYLKQAGTRPAEVRALMTGTLTPRANWWTPNQLNIKAGEAGFNQLMVVFALEPQYFADGTVFFTVDRGTIPADALEARKPTCFDGMQSSMWVPREDGGEAFGVSGGGIAEVMAKGVPASSIVNFQCHFPAPDVATAIKTFNDQVTLATGGTMMDALDRAGPNGPQRDQVGADLESVGPGGRGANNLAQGINNRTTQERQNPTNPAQVARNSTVQGENTQRPRVH